MWRQQQDEEPDGYVFRNPGGGRANFMTLTNSRQLTRPSPSASISSNTYAQCIADVSGESIATTVHRHRRQSIIVADLQRQEPSMWPRQGPRTHLVDSFY